MKKKLPIIISASALLLLAGSLGFALRNNIKPQTVSAQEYQIQFTANDVDETMSDMVDTNTAWIYFEKETPKGNTFGLDDFGTLCGESVSWKENNHIFTISDSGNGHYSLTFKFNLEMATFDHITFLGSFTSGYGENTTTTTYITYNEIDVYGYVVCYLGGIYTATVDQINVVYHC